MDERIIENAKHYLTEVFKDNADGHDVSHSLRVYQNALRISRGYPECDRFIVALASLLHDVDDHKLFDTENNKIARQFLTNQDVENDDIERICTIINGVSFSKNRGIHPKSIEGKIVQDADRIDAMGAIGIARTFAYGGKNRRTIESSLHHFNDKLLLLKDEMNTAEAKEMAEARHRYMEEFLLEFHKECCD